MSLSSSSSFCLTPTKAEKVYKKCTRNSFIVYCPNKSTDVWNNNENILKIDVLSLLPITKSSEIF